MQYFRKLRPLTVAACAASVLALGACDDDDDLLSPGDDDDEEIVGSMMAANSGEVLVGEHAVDNATTAEVIEFAEMMVTEHTAANEQLENLDIDSEESGLSLQLTASAQQTRQLLSGYGGTTYDRMYMQSQVNMHTSVLNLLDDVLIPAADDDDLEDLLREQRAAVAEHLEMAEDILAGL